MVGCAADVAAVQVLEQGVLDLAHKNGARILKV